MKTIKVYGSGCATCGNTKELIRQVASELGVEVDVQEVTDMAAIMAAGIMSTPGVEIDGEIVHTGGMPSRQAVEGWLKS